MKVKVKDEDLIGKRFKSNNSNYFTVIAVADKINRHKAFEIEFDEVNGVKYRNIYRKDEILKCKPKNPFYPSTYGIGYLGNAVKKGNDSAYFRWKNMISRCYNPDSHRYNTYGEKGITVCERWLCFEYYLDDFENIDGYDKDNIKNLQLDKDIKFKGNKIYSLETCMFVSQKKNTREMNERLNQKSFIAVSPSGEIFESNNQRGFSEIHNLSYKEVSATLKGRQRTHKGWTFTYKGE